MSQTILNLLQAMLKGLIEEMGATDATILLPNGTPSSFHLLARVGRLSSQEWYALLSAQPADLLCVPLHKRTTEGHTARLCIYRPGKDSWGRASRLSVNAVAAGVDYLMNIPGNNFNWMQLVASRRILSVTEEELTRLVLDIHDGPVQKLFAALNLQIHIRAMIERAERSGELNDASRLLPEMIQVIDLLESSLREIRSFLAAFQSAEVAERTLLEVLEALVLQHEQLTGCQVYFETMTELPKVSTPVKIAFYRILQEALSNASQHGQVEEIFVRLWSDNEQIHLKVIDFGKGFTPPALNGPTATEEAQHIGLRGMRERVSLVGGSLKLESTLGEGTRIQVSIPVS